MEEIEGCVLYRDYTSLTHLIIDYLYIFYAW